MKRRSRKQTNTQQLKQEQRARFNMFKRKVIHYLKLFDVEECAQLLEDAEFRSMYTSRNIGVPKIVMAKGLVISDQLKNDIINNFNSMFSNKTVKVMDGLMMSPKEIMSDLLIIDCAIKAYKDNSDIRKVMIAARYAEKVQDFTDIFTAAFDAVERIMQTIGMILSNLNSSLCWLKYISQDEFSHQSPDVIEVHEHIPKKRMMIINHHPRPTYPLYITLPNVGPHHLSVPAEKLNLPNAEKNKRIPVYFQNHLLHRLEERLDCLPRFINEWYFCLSIIQGNIIRYKGKIYAEYLIDSTIKLGYILLEFEEDVLLAKTFLLLSNSGTPEGEKLNKISGMKKFDHKYWSIDKLSTFHNSDLKDHQQLREIFDNAGCGSLFEKLSIKDNYAGAACTTQAQQMIRYLKGNPQDAHHMLTI